MPVGGCGRQGGERSLWAGRQQYTSLVEGRSFSARKIFGVETNSTALLLSQFKR